MSLIPNNHPTPPPEPLLARWVRRGRHFLYYTGLVEQLSWAAWLISVGIFAFWTHQHYRAVSGTPWIGMTIRSGVFATWTQVLREWLMIYVRGRRRR